MENTWGPRKTEPEPEPCGRAELTFFTIGAVAVTVAVTACGVEYLGGPSLLRGAYALLAASAVTGFAGWSVVWAAGRAERRTRCQLEALRSEIAHLAALVQSGVTPTGHAQVRLLPSGRRYFGSAAVGGDGDTVPMPTGLDPETIAAARTIARRMLEPPTDPGIRRDGYRP
ncbi:hypothetical protein [Micromonospora marina]|uniref:hypothetical protein n=1 Tax=Micromonospora marina TaxID=307120 RepID=UPI00345727AE